MCIVRLSNKLFEQKPFFPSRLSLSHTLSFVLLSKVIMHVTTSFVVHIHNTRKMFESYDNVHFRQQMIIGARFEGFDIECNKMENKVNILLGDDKKTNMMRSFSTVQEIFLLFSF